MPLFQKLESILLLLYGELSVAAFGIAAILSATQSDHPMLYGRVLVPPPA